MLEPKINSTDKNEIYSLLFLQCKSLIQGENELISLLSNFIALLKQSFSTFSWVGFYLIKNGALILGPFQGKTACSRIELGKGVCGTSTKLKKTIIVKDVNKFKGHIVCDSNSKSEIVVPIMAGKNLFGVLDIDSYEYSNFDNIDKDNLEKLCYILSERLTQLNGQII